MPRQSCDACPGERGIVVIGKENGYAILTPPGGKVTMAKDGPLMSSLVPRLPQVQVIR